MRALMLMMALLAGCEKKPQTNETETPDAKIVMAPIDQMPEKPVAFDPTNGERTLHWMVDQKAAILQNTKPGNDISYKDAQQKIDDLLTGMKDKSLKWKVKIAYVQERGVGVEPIEFASVATKGIRHYSIRFMAAAEPKPKFWNDSHGRWPGETWLFKHDGWANNAGTGDAAILQGTIADAIRELDRIWDERGVRHSAESFILKINGRVIQP